MKKYLALFLILLLMFSIVGCNNEKNPPDSETISASETDVVTDYITEENGVRYLVLPISKTKVKINENNEDITSLINNIDIKLLKAADKKFTKTYSDFSPRLPVLSLSAYGNTLYLVSDLIVDIEGYTGNGSGCDLDHKHVTFEKRITK